jgi:hypothetical protein
MSVSVANSASRGRSWASWPGQAGEERGLLSMTHRDPSKPYAVTIIEGKEIYMEDLIMDPGQTSALSI